MNHEAQISLFDRLRWQDPLSGRALHPTIVARTPAGVPIYGALRIDETNEGYPIVDCVARLTVEAAHQYREWLQPFGLRPPSIELASQFQSLQTVDSFGFQWSWRGTFRSPEDLGWRVAGRFNKRPEDFSGLLILDAGAGAGDQTQFLLDQGAQVLSVDLSQAIDLVARKHRLNPGWFGMQGDLTALPLSADSFDLVYCEGVIQHTRDSAATIGELFRVLRRSGVLLASHYPSPETLKQRLSHAVVASTRRRLSRLPRDRALLATGILASIASIPALGWPLRRSGVVPQDPHMHDFGTMWTNTYDMHGGHTFQRYLSSREFRALFEAVAGSRITFQEGTQIVATKN